MAVLWKIVADVSRICLGADLRSLACFRIALAAVTLADLVERATDMTAFYTDAGVLPRWRLLENFAFSHFICLHNVSGLFWVQVLLFAFHACCSLSMLVGYRTGTSSFLSWLLLISLQSRNHLVLHGGDVTLRCLMFWCLFLPIGERFSVDSCLRGWGTRAGSSGVVVTPGTVGLFLQVCVIYWSTAYLKSGPEWHNGTAVYYALRYFLGAPTWDIHFTFTLPHPLIEICNLSWSPLVAHCH